MSIRFAALALALAASSFVHAKTAPEGIPIAPAEFAQARPEVEEIIRKSDRYRSLDRNERKEITDALDRMEKSLASVSAVDELDPKQRTQLFNDQETVNQALTQAQGDTKVICKREKKVGTNFRVTQCATVAELRAHKDAIDNDLPRIQRNWPAVEDPS
jgi:Skp family chaperone for outer membrane proteins